MGAENLPLPTLRRVTTLTRSLAARRISAVRLVCQQDAGEGRRVSHLLPAERVLVRARTVPLLAEPETLPEVWAGAIEAVQNAVSTAAAAAAPPMAHLGAAIRSTEPLSVPAPALLSVQPAVAVPAQKEGQAEGRQAPMAAAAEYCGVPAAAAMPTQPPPPAWLVQQGCRNVSVRLPPCFLQLQP